MQICLLTKIKIGNWHIYGQAYHSMIRKIFNISGKDWQLAAIPKKLFLAISTSQTDCNLSKYFFCFSFFNEHFLSNLIAISQNISSAFDFPSNIFYRIWLQNTVPWHYQRFDILWKIHIITYCNIFILIR